MKPPVKKTKHKLLVDTEEEWYFIGLVSAEADYRTSIILNKHLNISLKNNNSIIIRIKNRETNFSRFSSESKYSELSYDLISNKSKHEHLLPKFPNLDFILRISGVHDHDIVNEVVSKIRDTKEITGVFILDKEILMDYNIHQIIP